MFGAIPVNERVVVDGNWVFAAGVTAGIDGALRLAAELRGVEAAQAIQLHMVYVPEPPFNSGTPETAPAAILDQARKDVADITAQREATARRIADRLGVLAEAGGSIPPRYRGQSSRGSRRAGRACGGGGGRSTATSSASSSCGAGGIGGRLTNGARRDGSGGSGW